MIYSPEQFVPAAQKYLDEKVAKIDRKYHAVDGLPIHLCQTGELYVEREESLPMTSKSAALRDMVNVWYCGIGMHAGRGGKLYWRVRPTITYDYKNKTFRLYSRLRITRQPEVWPTLAEYEKNRPVETDPELDDYRFDSRAA